MSGCERRASEPDERSERETKEEDEQRRKRFCLSKTKKLSIKFLHLTFFRYTLFLSIHILLLLLSIHTLLLLFYSFPRVPTTLYLFSKWSSQFSNDSNSSFVNPCKSSMGSSSGVKHDSSNELSAKPLLASLPAKLA